MGIFRQGLVDRVGSPDFATTVGLIQYGYNLYKEKGLPRDRKKGFWSKVKDWLKEA